MGSSQSVPAGACVAGTTVYAGRTCSMQCGVDYSGGDYHQMPTSDFMGCLQACASDSVCTDAQFDQQSNICFLKSTLTTPQGLSFVDSAVCGSAQNGPVSSSKATTVTITASTTITDTVTATTASSFPVTVTTTATATATVTTTSDDTITDTITKSTSLPYNVTVTTTLTNTVTSTTPVPYNVTVTNTLTDTTTSTASVPFNVTVTSPLTVTTTATASIAYNVTVTTTLTDITTAINTSISSFPYTITTTVNDTITSTATTSIPFTVTQIAINTTTITSIATTTVSASAASISAPTYSVCTITKTVTVPSKTVTSTRYTVPAGCYDRNLATRLSGSTSTTSTISTSTEPPSSTIYACTSIASLVTKTVTSNVIATSYVNHLQAFRVQGISNINNGSYASLIIADSSAAASFMHFNGTTLAQATPFSLDDSCTLGLAWNSPYPSWFGATNGDPDYSLVSFGTSAQHQTQLDYDETKCFVAADSTMTCHDDQGNTAFINVLNTTDPNYGDANDNTNNLSFYNYNLNIAGPTDTYSPDEVSAIYPLKLVLTFATL